MPYTNKLPYTNKVKTRENIYNLKKLGKILRELEKKQIINSYSIQNRNINSNYNYSFVSFKINKIYSRIKDDKK